MFRTSPFRNGPLTSKNNNKKRNLHPRITAILLAGCFVHLCMPVNAVDGGWVPTIIDWFNAPGEVVTPNHVFRATEDLIAEIGTLREGLGADNHPPDVGSHGDPAPVHVYAKSLEVMAKVARVQHRLGMDAAEVGQIPIRHVEPRDVLDNVTAVLAEVRRIKARMAIDRPIVAAPLKGGVTPSGVYKNLADASYLLDGLAGRPLTPDDVYLNALYLLDELELIATKLRAPLALDVPRVEGMRSSKDVAHQVLRASYKLVILQTRLGMDASSVPNLTLVGVTPSEVFDATNMLLAEMTRIKHHLNIDAPRRLRGEPRNKVPTDVFTQVLLVIENLDNISATVEPT